MRILHGAAVAAALSGSAPAASQYAPADGIRPACTGASIAGRVLRQERDGDVVLDVGPILRLADIRLPEGGADARERPDGRSWLGTLAGSTVEAVTLGPADRWGRIPARLVLAEGGSRIDVAELLVGEGLARVDAGERDALCRPDLLALEDAARRRRVGLWAASPEPLPASDPERLRALAGQFVVVEGRVASVGERAARTYLNFGRDFARDFAVTVTRRDWAAMRRRGLSAETLRGRRVRVRGTLEMRRAPAMEIVAADMIEPLEGSPAAPSPRDAR